MYELVLLTDDPSTLERSFSFVLLHLPKNLHRHHVLLKVPRIRMTTRNEPSVLLELLLGLILLPQQSIYNPLAQIRPEIPRLLLHQFFIYLESLPILSSNDHNLGNQQLEIPQVLFFFLLLAHLHGLLDSLQNTIHLLVGLLRLGGGHHEPVIGLDAERIPLEDLLEPPFRGLGVAAVALDVGLKEGEVLLPGLDGDEAVDDVDGFGELPRLDLELHEGSEGADVFGVGV
ncbi:hypothetical protein COCNU_16G007410 [Cocos nucifera]|uniref:Uncharacterized protein n=1 Tax=Cocos nucifera TaxID=13894 RepID=A0A8K0NER1_COCNU|nr:hypothetical protein COCNU_16G007410 [Cocos nucifera]